MQLHTYVRATSTTGWIFSRTTNKLCSLDRIHENHEMCSPGQLPAICTVHTYPLTSIPTYLRTYMHTYLPTCTHTHIYYMYVHCIMYIRIIHVYTVHTYVCTYTVYAYIRIIHVYTVRTYVRMYVRTSICKYVRRHRVKILHIHMHAATNTLVPLSSQFDHCPLSVMDE